MRITFDVPDAILHRLLDHVVLPEVALVRYAMPTPSPVVDVAAEVAAQLRRSDVGSTIRSGQRIAIGAGSRGVARLGEIVAASAFPGRTIALVPDGASDVLWRIDVDGNRCGVVRRVALDLPPWASPAFGVEL